MLNESEYKIIVESSPNMIWRAGLDTLCDYFNSTWLKFTGRSMDQERANGWTEGIHPDDFDNCIKIYIESFNKRVPFEMEYRLKRFDGVYRWINDRGTPIFSDNHEFLGYIGSCMDVTDKIEGQLLRELAQTDGLTKLFNRQYFEKIGNNELLKAKRFNTPISLVILDIDFFKKINDTYGHLAGDYVLKEVSFCLKNNIRSFDILARFGGDEFVILLPNTDFLVSTALVDRLSLCLSQLDLNYDNNQFSISVSFGLTQLNNHESFDQLLRSADIDLYEKKKIKHNQ